NSSDRAMRISAIDLLARCGDFRAVEPLIAMLNDDDFDLRLRAISALSIFDDDRAFGPMLVSMFEMNPENKGKQIVDAVARLLNSADKWDRIAAANMLGGICDQKALDPLKTALWVEHDRETRNVIIRALDK